MAPKSDDSSAPIAAECQSFLQAVMTRLSDRRILQKRRFLRVWRPLARSAVRSNNRFWPTRRMETARPAEGRAMSTHRLFSLALCLAAAEYVNSANAQQTETSKAEAALAAKIKCGDFRKNADGTWTSGPPRSAPTLFPATPLKLMGSALVEQT
jgi:hypothetical protein